MQALTEIQAKTIALWETTTEPQTKSTLYDGHGYCCLGLFCRFILKLEPIDTTPKPDEWGSEDGQEENENGTAYPDYGFSYQGKTEEKLLPLPAWSELGLSDSGGTFRASVQLADLKNDPYAGTKAIYSLAEANDAGVSFRQIAAYCRREPQNVFWYRPAHAYDRDCNCPDCRVIANDASED